MRKAEAPFGEPRGELRGEPLGEPRREVLGSFIQPPEPLRRCEVFGEVFGEERGESGRRFDGGSEFLTTLKSCGL